MEFIVTLTYEDKYDAVHTVSRKAWTAEDGVYYLWESLEGIIMNWHSIDPDGVAVNASITCDDKNIDFCETYEFELGM